MKAVKNELSLQPAPPPASGAASPVRVAIFSDAFSERNGAGAYYHDLIAQLQGRVAGLRVFQPQLDRQRATLSIPMPGDHQQRLETPPVRRIRRACDELQPTIVVVVTPGLYGLLGAWEARRRGARLISAFHTDFEQLARMYWNPVSRFFVNLVVRTANRIICSASRSVLINNAGLRDEVIHLGARQVDVIGTPLAPEFLERPLVPIAPTLQRVCFAGRLAPEKNVEHIVHAARALPDIEFVIGGDGPLRTALEHQAGDCANLRFAGWLNRSELIDLIDSASLLLLPSAFETFGSVALEAMARGRPALVSTTTGIHGWPALRDGLFSLESPEELGSTLRNLRTLSEGEWQARSRRARAVATALNDRTIDHWLQLLSHYQRNRLPGADER